MPCPPAIMPVIRFDQAKRSFGGKRGEICHLAFGHEALEQLRVHAVDAENNELLIAMPFRRALAGEKQRSRSAQGQSEAKFPGSRLQEQSPPGQDGAAIVI